MLIILIFLSDLKRTADQIQEARSLVFISIVINAAKFFKNKTVCNARLSRTFKKCLLSFGFGAQCPKRVGWLSGSSIPSHEDDAARRNPKKPF
jgi:hypothetical protein